MVNARDAFFLGAQLALERASFVYMLEFARMYEKGGAFALILPKLTVGIRF